MIRVTFLLVICLVGCALVSSIPFQGPKPNDLRIVNGERIDIKEAPFMVMLIEEYDGALYLQCGGTIVNPRHVLSSGLCVTFCIKVVAGSTTPELPHAQEIWLKSKITHPLFDTLNVDYDFGVLVLMHEIKFNDAAQPIALTTSDEYPPAGDMLWTYGWGATKDYIDSDVTLRRVGVLSIDHEKCKALIPPHSYYGNYTDRMMCTDTGPCVGDYGGPLVHNGVQVGITGYRRNHLCSQPAAVYSRIGSVLGWIQDTIK